MKISQDSIILKIKRFLSANIIMDGLEFQHVPESVLMVRR